MGKKLVLFILTALISCSSYAQRNGLNWPDGWFLTGPLTIGKAQSVYQDTYSILDIGFTGIKKAVYFRPFYKDSITSPKKGMMGYDIAWNAPVYYDSTHARWVRFITLDDSAMLATRCWTNTTFTPMTRTINGYPLSANISLVKSDVGLGNADNTSDVNKPISTATQTALDGKVPITRTVNGYALSANVTLAKADVGLSNVDNTSDASKPISTATQTALDGKVPITRTVNGYALSANVTLAKSDVGLSNVDNTSDASKPISTATQTALNGKVATTTTVNGYALSSNVTIAKADVGLGNVDNTSDATKNAAVVTLTNKTISGSSNTITNIANGSLTNSTISNTALGGTLPSHTASTGLTGTAYNGTGAVSWTANLATGVSGGQSVVGGTGSGESLTYSSTTNATKGTHIWGSTSGMVYDENAKTLRINRATAGGYGADINGTLNVEGLITTNNALKLKGYTGAPQGSAALCLPGNTMVGWAAVSSPTNLKFTMQTDGSDAFTFGYGAGIPNIFTVAPTNSTPTFVGYGFTFQQSSSASSCIWRIVAQSATTVQIKLENNSSSIMQIDRPASTDDITMYKNVSGTTTNVAKFNTSGIESYGYLKTVQPSANGQGAWKLGKILTGSDTNKYVELDVDGTVYYLRAFTSLP